MTLIKSIIFKISIYSLILPQIYIAVNDFVGINVSQAETDAISDRLRFELVEIGLYNVLERSLIKEILNEKGLQLSGCVTNECIVEVGTLLGVDLIIGGSVSKVGTIYSITGRLIDIETGEISLSSNYSDISIDNLLLIGTNYIANELSGLLPPIRTVVDVKKAYIKALEEYQDANYLNAIDLLYKIIDSEKGDDLEDNAYYWIAECYYSLKDYENAIKLFRYTLGYDGSEKQDDAQLKIGLSYQSKGDIENAVIEYQKLLNTYPKSEYFEKAKSTLNRIKNEN